jgi:divalent metal cation (Fe/Co/Zn/Cd) transporter
VSYRPNDAWQQLFYFIVPSISWQLTSLPGVFSFSSWHDEGVAQQLHAPFDAVYRRVQLLQLFTIAGMTVEAGASLLAARLARSPALLAFGGDSLVELLSASVVLWRFASLRRSQDAIQRAERRAARLAGILLLLLAAFVAAVAFLGLLGYHPPRPSLVGIFVLCAAVVVMPWLAREKRKISAATGSAALRADAAESSVCGYLSLIALAGLLANFVWNLGRADSIAAIALIPFILYEAREAVRGKPCACH